MVAVVTGGNRGIGWEVGRLLAERGYWVVLGSRDIEAGRRASVELAGLGLPVSCHQLDITDPASVDRFLAAVRGEHDRLDVLVNNAAAFYDSWQRAVDADLAVVGQAVQTNLLGAWRMCQACLPLIRRRQRGGRIVNVSSGAGALTGMSGGTPAYGVSKAALNALTIKLAAELRSERILVNAVCPGWVATDMGGRGGRPVRAGARSVVWAVELPDDGPTGGFFRDGRRISW